MSSNFDDERDVRRAERARQRTEIQRERRAHARREKARDEARKQQANIPYRAGSMILLSLAVVFAVLTWMNATAGDKGTARDHLEAADSAAASTAAAPTSAAPTQGAASAAAPSRSAPASGTTASSVAPAPNRPAVCVFNNSSQNGLAATTAKGLEARGWKVTSTGNFSSNSVTEPTVFYGSGQSDAASAIAALVGGSTAPRPSSFTQCPGGLALVVVSGTTVKASS